MLKLHNRSAVSENIQIPKIHTLTMRTLENSSISVPVYLNLGGPTPSCRIALPFCQLYERAAPATLSQKTAQTLTPINLEHFLLLVCTNCQPVNRRLSTDDNSRLQFYYVFRLRINTLNKTLYLSYNLIFSRKPSGFPALRYARYHTDSGLRRVKTLS